MTALTEDGKKLVSEAAIRHGVSTETAEAMLMALVAGNGTQAQFNIAELGGMGQWSQGGMTMVGDMFNNALKARVDALCTDLANILMVGNLFRKVEMPAATGTQSQSQSQGGGMGSSLFIKGGLVGASWPEELGAPSSTGSQNNLRYAVFPQIRRLAIDFGGRIEVYDTGDHQISGVSQQQSGDQSLTFTSQHGLVSLRDLPRVGEATPDASETPAALAPEPVSEPAPAAVAPETVPTPEPVSDTAAAAAEPAAASEKGPSGADEVIALIRKLGDLKEAGLLTEDEFAAKKRELLDRL
ncbi:SHOCT domain-containing protein [Salipiger bermudensis]|uniref:SHOCT domain-containing protein n=1 Tax=Salipiger bermudensis TaxID=344736 RepID=UPI001C994DF0|nr:SHOCT domain-containing protein [Salipiger bermudensis]MBY6004521.1 SHOCT domain-containing protein [Salipiger bermudensis]